jgi:hypothetical protein
LAGVVVPELRGEREALEGLRLRVLEVLRPFPNPLREQLLLPTDLSIEEVDLQDVADPQEDFLDVERLGEENRARPRRAPDA